MANKFYYRLGEKASVFYDPSLGILIRGAEVVALDKNPKSKKFNLAKNGGHVIVASKDEYDEYCQTLDKPTEVGTLGLEKSKTDEPIKGKLSPEEVVLKKTLEAMGDNQAILDYFIAEGFLEEDIASLTNNLGDKKSAFIKLAIELNREYK